MEETTKRWLRIYPEEDSATVYRIGLPPDDEDSNMLEDTNYELYFAQSGCVSNYELSDEDQYPEGADEQFDDYAPYRSLSSILSAFDESNPEGLSNDEIETIKAVYGNPVFDDSVPECYRQWIRCFANPGMTEEGAVKLLFKYVISNEGLETPVGIEVDVSEEEQLKVGFLINTDDEGFDESKLELIAFECGFEGGPEFLRNAMGDSESSFLNLIVYNGVFYANSDEDDGFWHGSDPVELYSIDAQTLNEIGA